MNRTTITLLAIVGASMPAVAQTDLTTDALHVIMPSSEVPRAGWAPQDPADELWRDGKKAINDGEWQRAANLFGRIRSEAAYRASAYRYESFYWEAYARERIGSSTQLRSAREILASLKADHPEEAKKIRDADALLAKIEGRLSSEYGDQAASEAIRKGASRSATDGCPDNDDDSPRVAALNALLQMDAESAMPILEKIMLGRDACSAVLRRQAVFMISQKQSPRSAEILLNAAKTDPDPEVKQQAVFFLSQVDSERAMDALEDILRTSTDRSLQEAALFAMSQKKSDRATRVLRDYATRSNVDAELRANAIFFIGQAGRDQDMAFLRDLYGRESDNDVKEKIIHGISQKKSEANANWLMGIAMNAKEDAEMRKQALFWVGQQGLVAAPQLVRMYGSVTDRELKEQLIFVYGQGSKESAFVDKLLDIAKTETDKELRNNAIFWLGQVASQSKDPRILKFLADLING